MVSDLNIVRIIRIIAGIGFVLYGLMDHHYLLSFMGTLVFLMGILNIGCPFNSCSVSPGKNERTVKEIEYEDISK